MQYFLGTSLTKPIFNVKYLNQGQTQTIDIFFGGIKFTTIPNDKRSLLFKSTIAMLVNAGVRILHIQNAFHISFQTIQRCKAAFESLDVETDLIRNPGRIPYKMNDKIKSSIFNIAKAEKKIRVYGYIKRTIKHVKEVHGINISHESIRLIIKKKLEVAGDEELEPTLPSEPEVAQLTIGKEQEVSNQKGECQKFRNNYAGVYLLTAHLALVFSDFPTLKTGSQQYSVKSVFLWWMLGFFLGAINLERLRHLHIEDFEFISGYNKFPCVEVMRNLLHELSTSDDNSASTFILKKNIDYFVEDSPDYYLDGHTEEYTGNAKLLSGWSTLKNRVCKGSVDYFVHDGAGTPIFAVLLDNFYDFREVIKKLLKRIKKLCPQSDIVLIYDRGGFSTELMKEIEKDENQYFITWQKGFEQKQADNISFDDHIKMEFPYNDLGKFKEYKIYFGEDQWSCKGYQCRRIIIRKEGTRTGYFFQSILTNDLKTDGGLIVKKMLKRSLQELDFKKEKAHFGLDEITSYKKVPYGVLADKDPNKEMKNPKYTKKLLEISRLKKDRASLFEKIGIKFIENMNIEKIDSKIDKEILAKIKQINESLKSKKEALEKIPKQISKLEQCISVNKVELDLRAKRLFGLLKITARNIFESSAKEFLTTYKNLRDYQKVFRKLTRTGGEIEIVGNTMFIQLDKFGRKGFQTKCNEFLETFNRKKIRTLDNRYILQFKTFS